MLMPDGCLDVPAGKLAAVVTMLQMQVRPPRRPEAADTSWGLRRVERPGLDWYRGLFRRVGEEWLWFSRLALADAALAAIVHAPAVEVYAFEADGRAEGLLELDFREPGECQLAFFGLTAAVRGAGAGRWLMNRALDRAWSQPIRRLWVHTCSLDHPSAVGFYIRSGFVPYRRQVEVTDDPRLTGALPRQAAPHVPVIEPGPGA